MLTRSFILCTIGLLSVTTGDVAAQQQTRRFDAARAPVLEQRPHLPGFEGARSERETPSYNSGRIVFSTLGTAVGAVAGALAVLGITNNPYGPVPGIGAALGAGTGAALGLLLPGGASKRVVGPTLEGTAVGIVLSVAGFLVTGDLDQIGLLWIPAPLVGAHVGFSRAISSD